MQYNLIYIYPFTIEETKNIVVKFNVMNPSLRR